eukprot:159760-Pleurochrysis_carterae.AAC.4
MRGRERERKAPAHRAGGGGERGPWWCRCLRGELPHDALRCGDGGVPDAACAVGDAIEQQRQDRDDVRLEQPAERLAQALKSVKGALAR